MADFSLDGIINIDDSDINGNEILNLDEFNLLVQETQGVFYDITEQGIVEIPLRMGFMNNKYFIVQFFHHLGISLRQEMILDWQNHPEDYITTPDDARFDRNLDNMQAWLKNTNKVVSEESTIKPADIIFFQSGLVGIAVNKDNILIADPQERRIVIKPIFEDIKLIGRILNTD